MKAILFSAAATLVFLCPLSGRAEDKDNMMADKSNATEPGTAKPLSRAQEILQRFDKNGDGKLDEDEKADAHEAMLAEQMNKDVAAGIVRQLGPFQALVLELFDRNHDHRIDPNERLDIQAFLTQPRGDGVLREVMLKHCDKNNDGILDKDELEDWRNYVEEHRGEIAHDILLKRYDLNANGELDPEEKTAIREAFINFSTPTAATGPQPAGEKASAESEHHAATPQTANSSTGAAGAKKIDPTQSAAMKAEIERRRAARRDQAAPVSAPADQKSRD